MAVMRSTSAPIIPTPVRNHAPVLVSAGAIVSWLRAGLSTAGNAWDTGNHAA